ncbi:MAG: hypothetical protein II949_12715 [Prevotella sp.]|nr:hypothetical protein [Prevotella sp.]
MDAGRYLPAEAANGAVTGRAERQKESVTTVTTTGDLTPKWQDFERFLVILQPKIMI